MFESNLIVQTAKERKMISIKRYTWEMCFKFEIVVMLVLSYIIARLEIRKLVKFQGSHHLKKALGDSLLSNHCLQESSYDDEHVYGLSSSK